MIDNSKRVQTIVRLNRDDYKLLKKLAYLKEVSINSLIDEAVKISIEKERKVLTNADIVIT